MPILLIGKTNKTFAAVADQRIVPQLKIGTFANKEAVLEWLRGYATKVNKQIVDPFYHYQAKIISEHEYEIAQSFEEGCRATFITKNINFSMVVDYVFEINFPPKGKRMGYFQTIIP